MLVVGRNDGNHFFQSEGSNAARVFSAFFHANPPKNVLTIVLG